MNMKYEIGEVFRHNNKTYMCVGDSPDHCVACTRCALREQAHEACKHVDCDEVHFEEVHEPREGMLFRASDGNMYQFFLDNDPHECPACACDNPDGIDCNAISNEAFPGYANTKDAHWLLLYRGESKEHKCESKEVEIRDARFATRGKC